MDGYRRHIESSLSADPVEEVKVGFEILKSLGLRHRGVIKGNINSVGR